MSDALVSNHWGLGRARVENGRIVAVEGHPLDPEPSALNDNIAGSLHGPARVLRPAVRQGWLDGRGARGQGPFVEVGWDRALDLIAGELSRIRAAHGNEAIYAGSYGWASAGRFHHAQSQLKRFLNCIGGFVGSEGNYSYGAAMGAMPHILGGPFKQMLAEATRWPVIARHADLVVSFGGLAARNMEICDGGNGRHLIPEALRTCRARGVRFVNLSPLRSDMAEDLGAEWLPPRPGSDAAIMLALAQTLREEGLHAPDFLDRYTVGFDRVAAYLDGADDGIRKDADWAAGVCGIAAETLRSLARRMAAGTTFITCAAALQRADWGEDTLWAAVTLAAFLGQMGTPGGGLGLAYAVNGHVGAVDRPFRAAALPQGQNRVAARIPVAMIADMLLDPGGRYWVGGAARRFPHARLVWWAGGNPFHHHQDLRRLTRAFQAPETVIVNEISWTATARHADIVLPVAAPEERTDFGAGRSDTVLVPMRQAVAPPGEARTEFSIYAALAERLGVAEDFTEGRDEAAWLAHLWAVTQATAAQHGVTLPGWEAFLAGEPLLLDDPGDETVFLAAFRADPEAHPRATPSGRIELYSQTVAGFGRAGHALYQPPREAPEAGTLALLSGQPPTRLHSQHDAGALSQRAKVAGREAVLIHPEDAAVRGVADGDVVELSSPRGRCLAGARLTEDIAAGAVFLPTGAWYDPDAEGHCIHGNPNVLTRDTGTSDWTQATAAHSCRVRLVKVEGQAPPVRAHEPPDFTG
ncbi:MAG: molybdopterin-dependent oxidoreductase [Pseudomonadota bacterium]